MATAGKFTKTFAIRCSAFAMLLGCVAPAWAGGKQVLSLGSGRGYDQGTFFDVVLTGASMTTVRSALEADGFDITASESFTTSNLVSKNIVFLGLFDPSESLTGSERIALNAFVRGGGALIYMGDNEQFRTPNTSVGGLFGVTYGTDQSATLALQKPNDSHPCVRGPGGTVVTYDASLNLTGFFGGILDLGPYAHSVLATGSRTVVAVIEPGVLQPGSGPVVFISEANGFSDAGVGTADRGDNVTLMRNIFAFASGAETVCLTNGECNDGLFCNGDETCTDALCQPGLFPCPDGLGCFENTNRCGPCTNDIQCIDTLFCNGVETCENGVCRHGNRPCAAELGCHEEDDTCGPCDSDAECADGLFCNGTEVCNGNGLCQPGDEPCSDTCQHCEETNQECASCMLDLDGDGFIGTGDFAFFAGCFGACYPNGHNCLRVNFDASTDGCVGTGDFAAFSGCFGAGCGECGNCGGPDDSNTAQTASGEQLGATVELVAVRQQSKTDLTNLLPTSVPAFELGETFFIEVWASRLSPSDSGLASVYVDLTYDPSALRVTEVIRSEPFGLFTRGVIRSVDGHVNTLGGCAQLNDLTVGVNPQWARVATLRVRAERSGIALVRASSAGETFGIAVAGSFGNLSPTSVAMDQLELTLGAGAGLIQAPQFGNGSRRTR